MSEHETRGKQGGMTVKAAIDRRVVDYLEKHLPKLMDEARQELAAIFARELVEPIAQRIELLERHLHERITERITDQDEGDSQQWLLRLRHRSLEERVAVLERDVDAIEANITEPEPVPTWDDGEPEKGPLAVACEIEEGFAGEGYAPEGEPFRAEVYRQVLSMMRAFEREPSGEGERPGSLESWQQLRAWARESARACERRASDG